MTPEELAELDRRADECTNVQATVGEEGCPYCGLPAICHEY